MRAFAYWLICMLLLAGLACSQSMKEENVASQKNDGPLTLDQWRAYKLPEKYEPGTLERLRMHDEKLEKSNSAWKKYFNNNVLPEMQKDIPRSTPR